MPRLAKGGKWTYGWVVVGSNRNIAIPPQAWDKFGFQVGGIAIFTPGSRTSGGFAISTPELIAESIEKTGGRGLRELGQSSFDNRSVAIPPEVQVTPGVRLLAVLGSRYGLGFVARGPIYEEAMQHPKLEVFEGE
ncbi:MAG: hypothetical protein JXA33_13655 [Anaerolineae bacterium]|nr:hypothetical protein [Anaerolineae bacterium]